LTLNGLSQPVRVVRDRWGVPHINARNEDDLFFAQGFVQAQDRLFQMDLWRRSVQGRLSEVLGPNFIERDPMTRRVQYRGDIEAEWTSYGPGTKAIATAFVRGVNAWVAIARERLPAEFALAGWQPEFWQPEDLLNRTDAFVASANARSEVFRARLIAAAGTRISDALLPSGSAASTGIPRGLDVKTISFVIGDQLRRVGTAPFFTGRAAGSNAWAVSGARSATGAPLVASDPHRALESPSLRYLVHLSAPGWNVIGATSPWLPGVAIGHNDRIAWGMTAYDEDTEDIYVEKVNPSNPHQIEANGKWVDVIRVNDAIAVKGRAQPLELEHEFTSHGVVVAADREKGLLFTMRWSGAEAGGAGELGGLALDRAGTWQQFRAALARWKMPAAEFVYADVDGNVGSQVAASAPVRRGWNGTVPVPGWTGAYEWRGWLTLDDLPHAFNPRGGDVAVANGNVARLNRLRDELAARPTFAADDFRRLQHDVLAWNAQRLVPLLDGVRADRSDVEGARQRLLAWDKRLSASSSAATLYVLWERSLFRALASARLDPALVDEYLSRAPNVLVPALIRPSRVWFEGDPRSARDGLLVTALTSAFEELRTIAGGNEQAWGRLHAVTFAHPLGVTTKARQQFNIGPFELPGYAQTLMSTYGNGLAVEGGASFREILDLADWDRSVATNAPGQSGSPGSSHFADLATLWAAGEYFPLAFSGRAVAANTETVLTLIPFVARRTAPAPSAPYFTR
jgi:penicillin G amidase